MWDPHRLGIQGHSHKSAGPNTCPSATANDWQKPASSPQGGKADSYDSALAETIYGLYKAKVIHRRGLWETKRAVELATREWVAWFNYHRLMEFLGYILPAEFEANHHRKCAGQAATV